MNNVLTPTSPKIVISAILAFIVVIVVNSLPTEVVCQPANNECNYKYGFPFTSSYNNYIGKNSESMLMEGFLLNIVVWFVVVYLISVPLMVLFNKFKHRHGV